MSFIGWIAIGCVVGACVFLYNSLIQRKNQVDQCEGTIQAYLKKRFDLIPNLVDTVARFMKHENTLLQEVTRLRTQTPNTPVEQMKHGDLLSHAMQRLMVSVESYPELKSNQNFIHLQSSLNEVEEQISAARRSYNSAVVHYNNGVEMIPYNIIAALMGLKRRQVFEAPAHQQENANVGDLFEKRAG